MKIKTLLAGMALSVAAAPSFAEVISVEVTNLTHGSYFTPLLLTAHGDNLHLFNVGTAATPELQAMAEGGSIDGLVALASAANASNMPNPAGGLLAPGAKTSVMQWDTGSNGYLSIVGMVLPSNDGFVGLNSWKIPTAKGKYTVMLNAYDAGTEANDEIVNGGGTPGAPGIPANPGANGGTGATGVTSTEANQTVHIHRGVIGDTEEFSGPSDLDSRIHRWLNPVAKLVVTVE